MIFHHDFIQSKFIREISTMKIFFKAAIDVHIEGHWHNTAPS